MNTGVETQEVEDVTYMCKECCESRGQSYDPDQTAHRIREAQAAKHEPEDLPLLVSPPQNRPQGFVQTVGHARFNITEVLRRRRPICSPMDECCRYYRTSVK